MGWGGRGDCGFYCLKKKKKNKLSGWTKINKWVQQGISWFSWLQLVQLVHLLDFFNNLIFTSVGTDGYGGIVISANSSVSGFVGGDIGL